MSWEFGYWMRIMFSGPNDFKMSGKVPFQSEITLQLVEKIIYEGKCELPLLTESASMHRLMIRSFLEHWNSINQKQDTELPIT